MEGIKSAARSALVVFAPYLSAGTMAGAVDLSFSSSANLEILELDFKFDAHDLPLVGACPSSERFNQLSWSKPLPASEEYKLGLIAGGWADGSIGVWNPGKSGKADRGQVENGHIFTKHIKGKVRAKVGEWKECRCKLPARLLLITNSKKPRSLVLEIQKMEYQR